MSAMAASLCCIIPLALAVTGLSSAWIGGVSALVPYQPIFIGISVVCLAAGFWLIYWRRERASSSTACQHQMADRVLISVVFIKGLLWLGAILVSMNVVFDYAHLVKA